MSLLTKSWYPMTLLLVTSDLVLTTKAQGRDLPKSQLVANNTLKMETQRKRVGRISIGENCKRRGRMSSHLNSIIISHMK